MATAVLPTAVGPTTTTNVLLLFSNWFMHGPPRGGVSRLSSLQ